MFTTQNFARIEKCIFFQFESVNNYWPSFHLDGVGQIDVGRPGVDGPLGGHDGVGDDDLLARDQRVVGRRIKVEVRPRRGLLGLK